MHETHSFRGVVAASVLASVLSVTALWLAHAVVISPAPVFAQRPTAGDAVFHTMPRGSSEDVSFIFYNPEAGEIWVYRDHKLKNHYRLTALGTDMEKLR